MSNFTLTVPDEMVQAAQQIAEATSQPLEQVLLSRLKNALPLPVLAPDEEHELTALAQLSDDALWTFAREQMPRDLSEQMETLMDKNSLGTIAPEEYAQLESLVERGQRLTLRKSEAAAILTRRGYHSLEAYFLVAPSVRLALWQPYGFSLWRRNPTYYSPPRSPTK